MSNIRLMLAGAFLAAASTAAAIADPNSGQAKSRPPLGNNPPPIIRGSQPVKPAPPAPQPPTHRPADHDSHDGPRHTSSRTYYVSSYSPNVSSYWGNYPYCDAYPYAYPPLYVSAESLYGPQSLQRFLGVDDGLQLRRDLGGRPAARDNDAEAPEPKMAVERATNARANALAWKFIGYGDAQFAAQKFADANQRYRKAAQNAPQLADAWFREGFALSAMGRYDLAVAAVKRGLNIDPNWPQSGFELRELYGPNELAKNAHLDALAQAALDKPNDANLLFLVGVYLHFDGQARRAGTFFQRAKELVGDEEYIRAFLK